MNNLNDYITQVEYFIEQAKGGSTIKTNNENIKERLQREDIEEYITRIYEITLNFFKSEIAKQILQQAAMGDTNGLNEYLDKKTMSIEKQISRTRSKKKIIKQKEDLEKIKELKDMDPKTALDSFAKFIEYKESDVEDIKRYIINQYSIRLRNDKGFGLTGRYQGDTVATQFRDENGNLTEEYMDIFVKIINDPTILGNMRRGYEAVGEEKAMYQSKLPEGLTVEMYPSFEYISYVGISRETAPLFAFDAAVINSVKMLNQYAKTRDAKINIEESMELEHIDPNTPQNIQETIEEYVEGSMSR